MAGASGPANVTAVTAGIASAVVSAAHPRRYLGIFNQSTTATVYIAFGQPAVAVATAGQLTLLPITTPPGFSSVEWDGSGFVPGNQINVIASAAATPVTVIE
jgi:uncharacterized membrane protein YedE/YeeE